MTTSANTYKTAITDSGRSILASGRRASVAIFALTVGLAFGAVAMIVYSSNRVGEITLDTPTGKLVVKVAETDDITEIVRNALKDPRTESELSAALLGVIETLSPGNKLREKILDLAADEREPFYMESIPAKLVADISIPRGIAKTCENGVLSKNIVVSVMNGNEMVYQIHELVDKDKIPCPDRSEIVRINPDEIRNIQHDGYMVKRIF